MRKRHFLFALAGFAVLNIAAWLLVARYLKQQVYVGMSKPYVSLFKTLAFPFPAEAGPHSPFVLKDWVFPKDAPVIGPNGEASMSMHSDGRRASISVRKGNVYYHTPLSFAQVCSLYRNKPFVEEARNAFEGVATDSNQHALFVCYGSSYNVFLLVTHTPESPTTNVTLNYRAVDQSGLPNQ